MVKLRVIFLIKLYISAQSQRPLCLPVHILSTSRRGIGNQIMPVDKTFFVLVLEGYNTRDPFHLHQLKHLTAEPNMNLEPPPEICLPDGATKLWSPSGPFRGQGDEAMADVHNRFPSSMHMLMFHLKADGMVPAQQSCRKVSRSQCTDQHFGHAQHRRVPYRNSSETTLPLEFWEIIVPPTCWFYFTKPDVPEATFLPKSVASHIVFHQKIMCQSIPCLTIPPGDPSRSHCRGGRVFAQLSLPGSRGFEFDKFSAVLKEKCRNFSICFKETGGSLKSRCSCAVSDQFLQKQ